MKNLLKCQVVMLPTEEASPICEGNSLKLYLGNHAFKTPQHLYLISDREIKEGDWQYTRLHGITQAKNLLWSEQEGAKKVIATTDKSLGYTDHRISPVPNFCDYPQLPKSFIQAFVKAYNEGKPINEVDLEYYPEEEVWSAQQGAYTIEAKLKTRPDNTVIIHQSKMYSREDMYLLASKVVNDIAKNRGNSDWNMFTTPKMIADEFIQSLEQI